MDVTLLEMPQDEATAQVKALKEMFRRDKGIKQQAIYTDMKRVYGHMKHGGKVIDLYAALKKDRLDADNNPRLAIVRADFTHCYLIKNTRGRGYFTGYTAPGWRGRRQFRKTQGDLQFPENTYDWRFKESGTWKSNIINQTAKTIVPLIPAHILIAEVKHNLRNYFILWEVEEWTPEPPIDPILLKRLTPNLFGILATWDLTEIERAIIRAHISRE